MTGFLHLVLAPAVVALIVGPAPAATIRGGNMRCGPVSLGLFDAFKKAFDNKDYTNSPATYEQTNARASHILVPTEAQALEIKSALESGSTDFSEAALKHSTCNSAARGGKLGKFTPGQMVKEFDDVVFGLYDTGLINPKNEADIYEPKYALDEVHGPVATQFGFHLIKIETRYISESDFRLKQSAGL